MNYSVNEFEISKRFPLSSKYYMSWVRRNSLGENVLYNLESLCEIIEFRDSMNVLDLGCGKCISSIFLAREFNVNVWAIDHRICASDNYERIKQVGCENQVLPLRLNARMLPFPEKFFDVIVAVDSYMYFGTDALFTDYISKFLKPNGQIGIVDICFSDYTSNDQSSSKAGRNIHFVRSLDWWYSLWENSGILSVERAEIVPENKFIRESYISDYLKAPGRDIFAEELMKDRDNLINIFRMSARKKHEGATIMTPHD